MKEMILGLDLDSIEEKIRTLSGAKVAKLSRQLRLSYLESHVMTPNMVWSRRDLCLRPGDIIVWGIYSNDNRTRNVDVQIILRPGPWGIYQWMPEEKEWLGPFEEDELNIASSFVTRMANELAVA